MFNNEEENVKSATTNKRSKEKIVARENGKREKK
jgi:hypothetical protein